MGEWIRDARYALRILTRAPGFTAVAVLSLALGIGANTAVLAVVRATLFEPLPVPRPEALRVAYWRLEGARNLRQFNSGSMTDSATGERFASNYSYPAYRQLRELAADRADVVAFTFLRQANVSVGGSAAVAGGMLVSDNYFHGLRVPMALGRGLGPEDDRPGAERAAVLSHGLWTRALGGDPDVVGRSVRLNGHPFIIVGVTARGYYGVSQGGFFPSADITIPLMLQPLVLPQWNAGGQSFFVAENVLWLRVMARLRDANAAPALEQQLGAAMHGRLAAAAAHPEQPDAATVVRLFPGRRGLDSLRGDLQRPLYILGAVVGLVFLIACVNLTSLVLARGVARQHEFWVRLALGSGRLRLARQTLIESLLLALAGGVIGVVLAVWGGRVLVALLAGTEPVAVDVSADAGLLLTGFGVSCFAGLLFGTVPAIRLARRTAAVVRPAGIGAGTPKLTIGRALVAVQIAVSLPLLVGAALFLQTLRNLDRVDLGFEPRGLMLFELDPTLNAYSRERVASFYRDVLARLEAIPGVRSVALMDNALVSGWISNSMMSVDGAPAQGVEWNRVSAGFFETMGIRIIAGRGLGVQDHAQAPRVAVINEAGAQRFFEGSALGRRLRLGGRDSGIEYEVVGIARNAKYDSLRRDVRPTLYLSYEQGASHGAMHVAVRTAATPALTAQLRGAVAEVDRDVPLSGMKTQAAQIDQTIARERVFSALLTFFGAFALLLACVGLHGVTAYAVARRTSEIGIRMALGAQRRSVIWLMLRQVVVLAVIGLIVGVPASVAAARSVRSLLYEVQPSDPISVAAAAAVMMAVALASGFLPARRASRMDPLRALRAE